MKKQEPFLQLELKKFKLKNDVDNIYHVYKDETNFSEITASCAGEAIEKSQIQEPFMVLHYDVKSKPHFIKDDLEEVVQEAPAPVSETPQAALEAKASEAEPVEGVKATDPQIVPAEEAAKTSEGEPQKAPEEKPQEAAKTEEPAKATENPAPQPAP
jgi:hypothetical protein